MLATIVLAAALVLGAEARPLYSDNVMVLGGEGASLLLDFGGTRPERIDLPSFDACRREVDRLVPKRAGGESPSLPSLKGLACVNRSAD